MNAHYTIALFLCPSEAYGEQSSPVARMMIERAGFDIVDAFSVTCEQISHGAHKLNHPARLLRLDEAYRAFVVVDVCPWPQDAADPVLDNSRLRRVSLVNDVLSGRRGGGAKQVATAEEKPPAWVTRNSEEAWQLLRSWAPGREGAYREECEYRLTMIQPPFEVVESFEGYNNNARVDLVQVNGARCVCKTFRKGRERYFENEVAGLNLSGVNAAIPPILEKGTNWLLMPYYENFRSALGWCRSQTLRSLLPMEVVQEIFEAALVIHNAGYAHLDFHPNHVLIGEEREVKLFDFDRLHHFELVPSFYESPMVAGADSWLDYDGPNGDIPSYDSTWKQITGLELRTLMEGSRLEQHAERMLVEARRLPQRGRSFVKRRKMRWLEVSQELKPAGGAVVSSTG